MWYTLLICQVEACVVTDSMWHENTTCKTETKNWSTTTTFPIAYTVIVPLIIWTTWFPGGVWRRNYTWQDQNSSRGKRKNRNTVSSQARRQASLWHQFVAPWPGEEQHLCVASAALQRGRLICTGRPLPTSMTAGIFQWLRWQLNVFPLSSCWAAGEMTAGERDGWVNYERKKLALRLSQKEKSRKNNQEIFEARAVLWYLVNMPENE
jgi:hypothetical protein